MRILIELPTWLGDATMATPAINNLIDYYGNPDVTFLGSSVSIEILKKHLNTERTEVIDKNYFSIYTLSKNLGRFDVYFSFRNSFRSKCLKFLISSEKKFEFHSNQYKNLHLVEKYNNFVNDALGTSFKPGKLKTSLKPKSKTSNTRPLIGINPGASYGNSKRWYPEEFAKVAITLSDQYDILIFGGINERKIAEDIENVLIKNNILNYSNLAGKTTLSELAGLITTLDLFITGDSGPMHLAASFQIPTIAIFGPTRDNETSQWMNKKNVILKKNLNCQPCMKRVCPLKHHNCMKLIKAEDVVDAINVLL